MDKTIQRGRELEQLSYHFFASHPHKAPKLDKHAPHLIQFFTNKTSKQNESKTNRCALTPACERLVGLAHEAPVEVAVAEADTSCGSEGMARRCEVYGLDVELAGFSCDNDPTLASGRVRFGEVLGEFLSEVPELFCAPLVLVVFDLTLWERAFFRGGAPEPR